MYEWFDRWLAGGKDGAPVLEIAVRPRPDKELLVCPDGQVNVSLRSRPLLPMAWEEFERKPKAARIPLRDLLGLDPDQANPLVEEVAGATRPGQTSVVLINGNESRDWRDETEMLKALQGLGHAVIVVDPRTG